MLDLSTLNKEQKEAVVTTEGYVRVIASPGSGKTRALTHRFAYLLEELKISPNNILCITYTNKAANEMKERILKLINTKDDFNTISTIHSYCDHFLRTYIDSFNCHIKSNYIIFDEYDLEKILKKTASYLLNDYSISELNNMLSKLKYENKEYIEYLLGFTDSFSFGVSWVDNTIALCKRNNSLMFDDLIIGTLYFLKNNEKVRQIEQKKYQYILVDEFQDTTPSTYELMKILSDYHKNLFVVGDPDQSIYEFIGANPRILLNEFIEDFPTTKTLLMNSNYRSTSQIIEMSNRLIENNVDRYAQKNTISADNKLGNPIICSHFFKAEEQYYYVCRIIKHLHDNLNYEYDDIYLLARNNYSFISMKKHLIKNNIPYVNSRTTKKLSDREEIKLIMYYLSFAISESAFSLYNINDIVGFGIPKTEMEEILNVDINPTQFLLDHSNDRITNFLSSNERIKQAILSNEFKVSQIIELILEEYEILSRYSPKDNDYFTEAENISEMIKNVIENETTKKDYSVYNFLDAITLDSVIESNKSVNAVKLMTSHGSKGLEAKNIIVFDFQKIPYNASEIECERRLAYVSFTRAKDNLFILSYGKHTSCFYPEFKNSCISVEQYFHSITKREIEYDLEDDIKDFNDEKKKAFKLLMTGTNVFITGEAGTGKTFLINKYIDFLYSHGKKVLICAPTGIAAANYKYGVTINKAFNIGICPSICSPSKHVSTIGIVDKDVIIIDEISMCRIDFFKHIIKTIDECNKIRSSPIQIVLCGDFFQLPPVILEKEKKILKELYPEFNEGFAFEATEWKTHNFNTVCLKEIFRQDNSDFIVALNNARKGIEIEKAIEYVENNSSKTPMDGGMEIHSRNQVVEEINRNKLMELKTKEYVYKADIKGEISEDVNVEREIHLKPGCKVMMTMNDDKLGYQNGSFATVVTCGDGYVDVMTDKEKNIIRVHRKEFSSLSDPVLLPNRQISQNMIGSIYQIPMKLAYAITIHKSQGQTYSNVNLDPKGWENGQIYVALSRIKDINGLYLYEKIDRDSLKVSNNVINFYKSFEQL